MYIKMYFSFYYSYSFCYILYFFTIYLTNKIMNWTGVVFFIQKSTIKYKVLKHTCQFVQVNLLMLAATESSLTIVKKIFLAKYLKEKCQSEHNQQLSLKYYVKLYFITESLP